LYTDQLSPNKNIWKGYQVGFHKILHHMHPLDKFIKRGQHWSIAKLDVNNDKKNTDHKEKQTTL